MRCHCAARFPELCGNFVSCASLIQILLIIVSVLLVVGIITCILNHYKMGARSWSDQRNRPQPVTRMQLQSPCPQEQQQDQQQQQPYTYSLAATTASIMYSPATLQERQRLETGAYQDHLVQLQSVQTDLILDLPHSIPLPDGEEHHHCNAKHLKVRDAEQHGEITRSYIRPPPNRTVHEVDSLPPFRSNSVGLLQKPTSMPLAQTPDNAPLVMRSHSMSSSSNQSGRNQKGYLNSLSNPNVPSQLWIPPLVASHHYSTNTSGSSGTSSNNSSRTYSTKPVTDSKYSSTDPPPPAYSDVVITQCDINTVNRHNSGV